MTTNNDLDALFSDAELPFGHPGRRFDDTPEGFDPSPLVDQDQEPDYTPYEDGGVVHYGPGDSPLCDNDCANAAYTDDPEQVHSCADCLELVAQDLADHNYYLVAACTAGGRSTPRAEWSGAGRSEGPARTAGGPAGSRSRTVDGM